MKKWMLAVAMVASIGVMTGCSIGSGKQTVKIEIKNMAFDKKEIAVKAGVPVELVLINKDTVVHDLSVDTIDITVGTEAPDDGHDHEHGKKQPDLHVSARPGKKGTVIFTPLKEGTYTFYCTVEGHEMAGMKGTLVVSADGKLPKAK